jgi:general secretion pathway protein G
VKILAEKEKQIKSPRANANSMQPRGFTIVELLIVIVVIGILAVISFVAYGGIQRRAATSVLESDLREAGTQLSLKHVQTDSYPNPSLPSDIKPSSGTSFQYSSDGEAYLSFWLLQSFGYICLPHLRY